MVEANPHEFHHRARIGAQSVKLIAEVNSRHFRWLGINQRPTRPHGCTHRRDAVEVAHPDEYQCPLGPGDQAGDAALPVILAVYHP
jgi:hypothetical protein